MILCIDVWKALWFTDPATGTASFGIGVGTLVLAVERRPARAATLFGCHSLRHSSAAASTSCRARRSAHAGVLAASSCLNRRHMLWAWCSLFSVGFS